MVLPAYGPAQGVVPDAADDLTEAGFARRLAELGPWGQGRQLGVAVSGGADSMALALLAASQTETLALIVDHGLRPTSQDEACLTAVRLRRLGIASRIITLHGVGRSARAARNARLQALSDVCRAEGIVDLLLGHHARDQAETVVIREGAGSGIVGLAGMTVVRDTDRCRLLRPLLAVSPGALRRLLQHRGVAWVEDPTNTDARSTRSRIRLQIDDAEGDGPAIADLVTRARIAGLARVAREATVAAELAERVVIRPEGFALVSGRLSAATFSALLQTISGSAYPPGSAMVGRVTEGAMRPCTLAGCRVIPAGRHHGDWLIVREFAALPPSLPLHRDRRWDRFEIGTHQDQPNRKVGALGSAASTVRDRTDLPSAVLRTLPAIWQAGRMIAVPHLGIGAALGPFHVRFAPRRPAAPAVFMVA